MRQIILISLILIAQVVRGQHLFPVPINGRYGFINEKGSLVIPALFEEEAEFVNNFALIMEQDYEIKVIDSRGKIIKTFPNPNPNYLTYPHNFSEGLLATFDPETHRYGFIDGAGNWVIKPKFYQVLDFSDGLCAVWEDADVHADTGSGCGTELPHPHWGYIDKTGRYRIRSQFSSATAFLHGIAIVNNHFIDTTGKTISESSIKDRRQLYKKAKFNRALLYRDPNIWVPNNDENFTGCRIMFHNKRLDRFGFKDDKGTVVIPAIYSGAQFFSEDLAGIQYPKGKWGYINCAGRIAIEPQYEFVYFFSEGLGAVKRNGKWGFVDTNGKPVIPFEYEQPEQFKHGLVKLEKNGKTLYLNRKGKVIWAEK
jgi:hypothetical protein